MADDRLSGLEADLEALKYEYERYFLGLEKRMPHQQRERVSRAISRFLPGNDAVERFRYQNLVQRLTTYRRYWDRILRAIEDGTYERDRFKADYRAKDKTGSAEAPAAATEAQLKSAAAVGDEAAAFLASLTGGRPPVASPSGGLPAVGLRGRPVGERPSLNTRELVREVITPGDGFAPRSPTGASPVVRASGGQPPVVMRGGPVAGRVSGGQPAIEPRVSGGQPVIAPRVSGAQPVIAPRVSGAQPAIEPRLSGGQAAIAPRVSVGQPAIEPRLSGGQPAIAPRVSGGQAPVLPRANLPPLPSRPTGGQPAIAPRPPAEPAIEARTSGAQAPIAPRAGAPVMAPRGQPVSRAAAAPMRGSPVAPSAAPVAPNPAPVAPSPPPVAPSPASPPAPMRGAPIAPPPAPMRGAPKAPPPAPMRGRPVGGDDSSG